MKDALLETYLADHFASAQGALELAKRVEKENKGSELGEQIRELRMAMEQDCDTLARVMTVLGAERSPIKDAGAWLAEKLGRFKLNQSVTSYSPLSRVEELEALASAVAAKRALWETLEETKPPGVQVDYQTMLTSADEQRQKLQDLHRRAVAMAFTAV